MRLHGRLMESSRLYNWWHHLPLISVVHFAAVIAVGTVLAFTIQNEATDQLIDEQVAQAVTSNVSARTTLGSLTSELLRLSKNYDELGPDAEAQLAKITQVAQARKAMLVSLAINSPKAFLINTLPNGIIEQLPDSVQALLEQDADIEGKLSVIHQDAIPKAPGEKTLYEVDSSGNRYHVHFAAEVPAGFNTGTTVRVHGKAVDNEIVPVAAAGGGSGTTVVTQSTAAGPTGPQKTLVILVNFTDDTSQPFTPADAAATIFTNPNSTNKYYQEDSFGSVSMTGDVVGWYTIPYTSSTAGCANYYTTGQAAKQAAINAGVPVSNYQHLIYWWNNSYGCSWGGMGSLGGNPSEAWLPFFYLTPTVVAHEFGHNLNTHHAQSLTCAPGTVGPYSTCTISEYGDPSDTMGDAWSHYFLSVASRKLSQSWLTSANVQNVTSSGTFTITGEETNDASIKMLKIAKPDTSEAYYVSLRQPIGFDAGIASGFTTGASVHIWDGLYPARTKLANGPLSDGASLSDAANGITITQVSHTTSSVTVSVALSGPQCTTAAPTASLIPSTQGSVAANTLNYTVSVKNNDSSVCSGSTFNLAGVVPSGWTGTVSPTSLNLSAGGSGSATFSVTSASTAADGTYPVSATVSSASGSASAAGSYTTYTDTVGPSLSITSPADGTNVSKVKGNNLKVAASASDGIGVASITLSFDGKLIQTCTGTTSCNANVSIRQMTSGTHTITAMAQDKAGNQTTKSVSVTK